jgi:tryptophan 2-monooxygenase
MPLPSLPSGFLHAVRQHRYEAHQALKSSPSYRHHPPLGHGHGHGPTHGPKHQFRWGTKPPTAGVEAPAATTDNVPTPQMAYIDAPDIGYGIWMWGLYGDMLQPTDQPIGTHVNYQYPIAVIGAGVSGCAAAYELGRAGYPVQVFEQSNLIGGRCNTVYLPDGQNKAEMGAMRFPGSEFLMSFYLNKFKLVAPAQNSQTGDWVFGIDMLNEFPDPGKVETLVAWRGGYSTWIDNTGTPTPPPGFEVVYWGWLGLATSGITQGGVNQDFQSPSWFAAQLGSPVVNANAIAAAWQNYITAFQGRTFYSVLQDLFTGNLVSPISGVKCDIPVYNTAVNPRTPWTFDDFDKFGTVGIGSGGFGALYPINFIEIYRLIINGLESQQKFFPTGIRALPEALANFSTNVTFNLQTPITIISGDISNGFYLSGPAGGAVQGPFSRVIVATTTRSMEINTNLTMPSTSYIPQTLQSAVKRTHVTSSVKIAARIYAFWNMGGSVGQGLPRVMQCDSLPMQAYTLDYGGVDPTTGYPTGMCFISYTWDDDAVKQQGIAPNGSKYSQDPVALYAALQARYRDYNCMVPNPQSPGDLINWADLLSPVTTSDIFYVEWESEPYYNGAFKLSQPGQDTYVQQMFWSNNPQAAADTGVYLAGDCASWTSGWVEGGLQTGLNAACRVINSGGGQINNAWPSFSLDPIAANPGRYSYFPTSAQAVPHAVAVTPKPAVIAVEPPKSQSIDPESVQSPIIAMPPGKHNPAASVSEDFIPITFPLRPSSTHASRRRAREPSSREQAVEALSTQPTADERVLRRRFEAIADASGSIDREEFMSLYLSLEQFGAPQTPKQVDALLAHGHAKKKERVDFDEFCLLMVHRVAM